jgi:O-antigen biosynthesis protein
MQNSELKSSRYEAASVFDRFDRNRLFVDEAVKYGRVLELGCSNGFLSKLIAAGGAKVTGVEIDQEAAAQARQYCEQVLTLNLNTPGWTGNLNQRFDLATYGDVLEHLLDPLATLTETKKVLNPGGRVLICLPNIAHWTVRAKLSLGIFEYQSNGLLDCTHLRFFTVPTAHQLIEDAGYKILWFRPIFGGRYTASLRPAWHWITKMRPNLFSYQMMFLAEPKQD